MSIQGSIGEMPTVNCPQHFESRHQVLTFLDPTGFGTSFFVISTIKNSAGVGADTFLESLS
jgi:hypothetical protein